MLLGKQIGTTTLQSQRSAGSKVNMDTDTLITNKNSGVRDWGENLIDQKNSGGVASWPSPYTAQLEEEVQKAHEPPSPSPSLPVPLYQYPGSSIYCLTDSCQLGPGSTLPFKVNIINTVSGCHCAIKYPATHLRSYSSTSYIQKWCICAPRESWQPYCL